MYKESSESPWKYKPWWCQPWSILLTGIAIIGASWVLGKSIWVTVGVSIPILIWMSYFLLFWPRLMKLYYQQTQNSIREE
ncbi:hypothetical protein NDA00_06860 [Funiculus sociatus GB2-M2]|uniref:DUF6737 family protein n=1 Tax=Cyanophyceae TaxID=3028117 RepID=UPI00321F6E7F